MACFLDALAQHGFSYFLINIAQVALELHLRVDRHYVNRKWRLGDTTRGVVVARILARESAIALRDSRGPLNFSESLAFIHFAFYYHFAVSVRLHCTLNAIVRIRIYYIRTVVRLKLKSRTFRHVASPP